LGTINTGARLRLLGELQIPAVNAKEREKTEIKKVSMQDFITRKTTKCVWATY
jgi:hypothetical protein